MLPWNNNCYITGPFDLTNMIWWYFRWMLLLLGLVVSTIEWHCNMYGLSVTNDTESSFPLGTPSQQYHAWVSCFFLYENSCFTKEWFRWFILFGRVVAIFLTTYNCDITGHSDLTKMTWWYYLRMLLLIGLLGSTIASNDTVICTVCQAPMIQNPHVSWAHLLSNTMHEFSATGFRGIRVLPKNAFVSAPLIQVCIQIFTYVLNCSENCRCYILRKPRFLEPTVCVGRAWIESPWGSGDPFIRME